MRVYPAMRLLTLIVMLACASPSAVAETARPNIIYILADDLGYGDLGCYGQRLIKTPNIDRLAEEGMKFIDHYSGSALCAPSRCVLLTGLHSGHCPIRNNRSLKREGNVPIPGAYLTLGEMMKAAGYATGAFGKWGLGFPGSEGDPIKRGFDHFFGYNCQRQAHDYYPEHLWRNDEKVILEGNSKGRTTEYSHDLVTEEVLAFIRGTHGKPFFVYIPYTIPHTKFQVPDIGEYDQTDWEPRQKIQAAMISRMDRDVGRILELVQEIEQDEDTLIIFTSDNGPHGAGGTLRRFEAAGPLRGKKGALYEGGIRVPFVARWPGRIEPGTVSDHVSSFQDMMPTFAAIAGTTPPENIDGISLLPTLLKEGNQQKHDYLYWELGIKQAVRVGNWNAVRIGKGGKLGPIELYDLNDDVGETRNVADLHADVIQQLQKILKDARRASELFPNELLDL